MSAFFILKNRGEITLKNKTLVLKHPIMINGVEVKEIAYDFDELSTKDLLNTRKQMIANDDEIAGAMTLEEADYNWHSYLFAAGAVKANPDTDLSDYLRFKGQDNAMARALGRSFFIISAEEPQLEN